MLLQQDTHHHQQPKAHPLHWACQFGKKWITAALLAGGAAWDTKTKEGQTPAAYARACGNTAIAGALLKWGAGQQAAALADLGYGSAAPPPPSVADELCNAVAYCKLATVQRLIPQAKRLGVLDTSAGQGIGFAGTPLHLAVQFDRDPPHAILQALLEAGANPNIGYRGCVRSPHTPPPNTRQDTTLTTTPISPRPTPSTGPPSLATPGQSRPSSPPAPPGTPKTTLARHPHSALLGTATPPSLPHWPSGARATKRAPLMTLATTLHRPHHRASSATHCVRPLPTAM